jgi:SpoVK/Ycf46/Vps4 family AAA+-type ATPase
MLAYSQQNITNLLEKRERRNKHKNKRKNTYKLGLVTYTNNKLDIMIKTVTFNDEYDDLEMLYDVLDTKFHKTLIDKIHTSSKGNIVFNGPPGTGKSFYIRKLIKDYYITHENIVKNDKILEDEDELSYYNKLMGRHSADIDKLFVYIPTNLSHLFSDPIFTSMLQDKASEYSKGLVIILEDAEKLIGSRDDMGSGNGVSALLNMSDGILNDIISTQFIFTYNTDTDNIDDAILRPGRLLAKKTFGLLPDHKANKLAELIGVDKRFYEDTSIATILSELEEKENSILIEEQNVQSKIGF